jgi:hypothetical protein
MPQRLRRWRRRRKAATGVGFGDRREAIERQRMNRGLVLGGLMRRRGRLVRGRRCVALRALTLGTGLREIVSLRRRLLPISLLLRSALGLRLAILR